MTTGRSAPVGCRSRIGGQESGPTIIVNDGAKGHLMLVVLANLEPIGDPSGRGGSQTQLDLDHLAET